MKQKQKRKHLESAYSLQTAKMSRGISNLHKYGPQSEYSLEDNTRGHEARDSSSELEYFSCDSSLYMLSYSEFWKSQEDAPETCVVVPVWSQAAEENPSASEYFSCVSSARKLFLADEDANRSFMSPVHMKKETAMKIYYTYVQMKRGVAVLWDREKELEPPRKKIRIEEMTFPEKIHREVTPSLRSVKELLTDSESNLDSKAQEEREGADSLTEPPVLEESSRARTPEWLVALDSGFRCMACCRVFPSVEALQKHVEHGVNEGFSCHAFHLARAWLKSKRNRKGKRKRRKMKKIKTMAYNKEKHIDLKTTSSHKQMDCVISP
nr:protein FAM170A-like isoform X2 [Microcebus murinus]